MVVFMLPLLGADRGGEADFPVPEISKRINAFSLDLLRQIAGATDAPANAILSPQSVFHGLAMSYIASGGETRKELAAALHFPDDNGKLLRDLSKLRGQLHASAKHKQIDFSLANGIWLDETYAQFRKEYVKQVQQAFAASLRQVKFGQANKASEEINKWVSEKTRGRISKAVDPSDFDSRSKRSVIDEAALVTVNAVYFKGDWASRFDADATRERPFHVDATRTRKTTMMHQNSPLNYSENDKVKFVMLPYGGGDHFMGDYYMFVVLPKKVIPIRELLAAVTPETIIGLMMDAYPHEVDVLFPKFEMNSHFRMKQSLETMGVKLAFDSGKADFDKMIVKKFEAFRIYVSQIYHDAWIDVHEKGTEAAAVTTGVHFSFGCSAGPSRPPKAQFHADHPFMFMIFHKPSLSIVFAGWISDPERLAKK